MKSIPRGRNSFVFLVIIAVLCLWAGLGECGTYSGGSGEPNDPYLIATPDDMNAIGADSNDWDKHFKLIADIDLSGTTYTTALIAPNWDIAFTGVFDGDGYKIRGLTIAGSNDYLGLIGKIDGGQVCNLGLEDVSVNGRNYIGSLVGVNYNGSVSNCYSNGETIGTGDDVGGLVGKNWHGSILNCYSTGFVNTGDYSVGGLVGGNNSGRVSNCYSTAAVSGYRYAGGLVGENDRGNVSNCYSAGDVSGTREIGGLVGVNRGSVSNCYSTASVSGYGDIGGLVGYAPWGSDISNCYYIGSVSGYCDVGGLVGTNWHGSVLNSYSTGDVWGSDFVGGLVGGNNSGRVSNCYSNSNVSGYHSVGGLAGTTGMGRVSNCYSTGDVSGNNYVGGLVGWNNSRVSNCYSIGDVSGIRNYVGGLMGYNLGSVSNCFWDVDTQSHGVADSIGYNRGTVTNVVGLTTAKMQTESTFTDAGWDFDMPIWWIDNGNDYPQLAWELVPDSPTLQSEPDTTLWTSNTISWDAVADANGYYAECAEDANFVSIIEDSGWIADVNCTFEGLELGQTYWYRVKARNGSGVESDWSNVESSMQVGLDEAIETVLDVNSLKNENMAGALGNKIDAVLGMIDEGHYKAALEKLENDILKKTDGCAEKGQPDKNDWINSCEEQGRVYPLIMETIEYVRGLI